MARALELARRGEAQTHPNPMVGCVVVRGGRAVGEGFHLYDKFEHAEIAALRRAGKRARGATLYVNLEPCCHTGRTGPCTKAIIEAGVKRVVAAMRDPNPAVAGRGLARLRSAGVRVTVGVREAEAQRLNEAFAKWIRTGRPQVTLKVAMTLDGKIAGPAGRRRKQMHPVNEQAGPLLYRIPEAAAASSGGTEKLLQGEPDHVGGRALHPPGRVPQGSTEIVGQAHGELSWHDDRSLRLHCNAMGCSVTRGGWPLA